jgi:hypothetical protein
MNPCESILPDAELFETLRIHLRNGREALIGLLRCLYQVEQRKLHLKRGVSSLVGFCQLLGFSECESWRRDIANSGKGQRSDGNEYGNSA